MSVKDVLKDTEAKMSKTVDAVTRDFHEVHTGRANPALVEEMHIDYYGAPTAIKQIASVSVPDGRTIIIQPWDPSAIPGIERGIQESHLGINPNNDGKIIRLVVPALSEERRKELTKVVKDMAEKGRVSLRTIRRDANDRIKKMLAEKSITEDDSSKGQENIQKLTDKYIAEVDSVLENKTHELMDI